ncbi:DMT family transporter [Peptostreptococcus russellii]|uniref:Permease of the drug/metabolite transporter (DMT) superfamily n=1 Tax=Peptostreptococcus russellii TaxID=215200 RepID=A0A1H8FM75_9FIRM|nr:DMT family transporter [Peptostreptococcus russellii]SEN32812.1 Permease of the drug/metabolite transporter (DMT) superfamily [Peptostreptococcus russellii]
MNQQKKKETQSALLMVLTAVIWGIAFVFQRTGMEHIGPFAFNFFRCLLSLVFLLAVSGFLKIKNKNSEKKQTNFSRKSLYIGGILAGLALFLGMSTQQVGMVSTSAAKAGFITTMYIVLVPIMGMFYGRKTTPKMWLCVAIAAVGLYMLSIKEGFVIEKGDFFVFLSAIFFGLQIVIIDIFAPKADAIKLSMIEFATSGVLSLIATLMTETTTMAGIQAAGVAILYTGLLSSGVGFTLQIIAQKNLAPTVTSLIMSMESGVSAIAGVIFLHEALTSREIVGCIIMIIAVLLAQLDFPMMKSKKSKRIESVELSQGNENRKMAQ